MKKIQTMALSIIAACVTPIHGTPSPIPAHDTLIQNTGAQNQPPIILEAKLLNLIDGTFFNADRIEEIGRFQYQLRALLLGDLQPDGTRVGRYLFQGKHHTVQTLHAQENIIKNSKELTHLLEQGKNDFIKISDEFRNSARGSKSFTVQLIEESCQKRGRMDSILLTWSHTTLEKEHAVFKKEVTNFEKLDTFLTDLFNFLTDLRNSCPKARALFHNRVEKYKKIKTLMPAELNKFNPPIDKMAFLTHLRRGQLDTLTLNDITPQVVNSLLKTFTQTKSLILNE